MTSEKVGLRSWEANLTLKSGGSSLGTLQKFTHMPIITINVNLSLTSGQFHPILKESAISPLLTKSTLDKDQLSNYRAICNLSLISNIIERVVKSRLTDIKLQTNY